MPIKKVVFICLYGSMSFLTVDKNNFAVSIGSMYDILQKERDSKFIVLPASAIQLDDDYTVEEYIADMHLREQISDNNNLKNLLLRADALLCR